MFGAKGTAYTYEVVEGFFRRPKKWPFVEVADVDVDADDNVYVFNRSAHPMMIFDRNGTMLDSWGELSEHYFTIPHALCVGPDGSVYTVDSGDHTVRKWTRDGRLLMQIGKPFLSAPLHSGEPFNRPTGVSVGSNGDVFVADGYGNARVHCFDPEGTLKYSWGARGRELGEFDTIHSVYVDRSDADTIYVADRYNNRVQRFTPEGEPLGEWTDLLMPNSIRRDRDGVFYIAELFHRVTICDREGTVLARWGEGVELDDSEAGRGGTLALPTAPSRNPMIVGKVRNEPGAGLFSSPHGIVVDSEGSIYVGDVAESYVGLDRGSRSVQKFVRVRA